MRYVVPALIVIGGPVLLVFLKTRGTKPPERTKGYFHE